MPRPLPARQVQQAVLQFLVAQLDHRVGEVRQLSLKCVVQAAEHWAPEVEALVGSLDPKSQQRRALKKARLGGASHPELIGMIL